MRDIIMNISILDGFIANEEMTRGLTFADLSARGPMVCGKYGGPPEEEEDLEEDNGDERSYC